MPFELPPESSADRRGAIWRWVSFGLVAILVATVTYLAYVGYVGSEQTVEPPAPTTDCRTPAIAYGWAYEVINYDPATDIDLGDLDDPTDCPAPVPPARAGDDLVTTDGVSLAGWYIPAAGAADPTAPTIVLAHGHGTSKSSMLEHAAVLHAAYNLVLFDFRNHGQSERGSTTVGVLERLDLRAVIDWIEVHKGASRIGVLGVSMGGATAAYEARADTRVEALVLDATHATLANALQARLERHGYPLGLPGAWSILLGGLLRTGQDMSAADPVQSVAHLRGRHLLVIGGGRDDALGASDAADVEAAARARGAISELRVCEEAGHAQAIRACPDAYRGWVLGFFARAFGAPS